MNSTTTQNGQVVIDPARVFDDLSIITNDQSDRAGLGIIVRLKEEPHYYRQACSWLKPYAKMELEDLKFPAKGSLNDAGETIGKFLMDHRVDDKVRSALNGLRSFLFEGKVISGSEVLIGNECVTVGDQ